LIPISANAEKSFIDCFFSSIRPIFHVSIVDNSLRNTMIKDNSNGMKRAMPNKYPEKKGWDVSKQKY
jgi:hypothetical protein